MPKEKSTNDIALKLRNLSTAQVKRYEKVNSETIQHFSVNYERIIAATNAFI